MDALKNALGLNYPERVYVCTRKTADTYECVRHTPPPPNGEVVCATTGYDGNECKRPPPLEVPAMHRMHGVREIRRCGVSGTLYWHTTGTVVVPISRMVPHLLDGCLIEKALYEKNA